MSEFPVYQAARVNTKRVFNTHVQEEQLDSMILRLQSLLDQLEKVQSIFGGDLRIPSAIQKEIVQSKEKIKQQFEILQKRGVPILSLLATFGEKLLRYHILTADEKLEEIQEKNRTKPDPTLVVDVVDEEQQLNQRQQVEEEESDVAQFLAQFNIESSEEEKAPKKITPVFQRKPLHQVPEEQESSQEESDYLKKLTEDDIYRLYKIPTEYVGNDVETLKQLIDLGQIKRKKVVRKSQVPMAPKLQKFMSESESESSREEKKPVAKKPAVRPKRNSQEAQQEEIKADFGRFKVIDGVTLTNEEAKSVFNQIKLQLPNKKWKRNTITEDVVKGIPVEYRKKFVAWYNSVKPSSAQTKGVLYSIFGTEYGTGVKK